MDEKNEGWTHQPYTTTYANTRVTYEPTYYNGSLLMFIGMQVLSELCVLLLRFRREPAYVQLLHYDDFEECYRGMLPSFIARCGVMFKQASIPLDLQGLYQVVRELHAHQASPMTMFMIQHERALLEVGASRWSH